MMMMVSCTDDDDDSDDDHDDDSDDDSDDDDHHHDGYAMVSIMLATCNPFSFTSLRLHSSSLSHISVSFIPGLMKLCA
jgi:ABC-type Zn2+ transport system substrate-binding protein/surface adhesin